MMISSFKAAVYHEIDFALPLFLYFLKKYIWAKPGLFFFHFVLTMTNMGQNLAINGKGVDGVLRIQTRDYKMVGVDEPTGAMAASWY